MASSFQFHNVGGAFDSVIVVVPAAASGRIINGLAATQTVSLRTTLKAFANSSPGRGPRAGSPHGVEVFALKPWVQKWRKRFFATLKELRKSFAVTKPRRNSDFCRG